jgi:hypothetical protein
MPIKLFKQPSEKADIEWREAYEKGVNLGPEKWPDAVRHFQEASKHYNTIGDVQKAGEAYALATLFYALSNDTAQAWDSCSKAMVQIADTQLNVGFSASSANIANQSSVLSFDIGATAKIDGNSRDLSRVVLLRELAQKYMDIIGSDLVVWRLRRQELDPQRRAFYFLGLASLIEGNSIIDSDPKRSVELLSEAATQFELAGTDPMNVVSGTKTKVENLGKFGQCWFCGREMQGQGLHYVTLPASISSYTRQRYGSTTPHNMEDTAVVACESCASSIRNVADMIARDYYDRAITQMQAMEQRLDAKISALEHKVNALNRR